VREKYFSLRPKPLERWLWQQHLSQAAERVFWLHWEEGMKSGDWCSQLPLSRVATVCFVDASTVTRAYQVLRSLGLIRRQDPGRDPANPFQQATAVTEVRLPKQLLTQLATAPNRLQIKELPSTREAAQAPAPKPAPIPSATRTTSQPPLSRSHIQATWSRASSQEQTRFFQASRAGMAQMIFDPGSRLTEQDREQLLRQLQQMAAARNCAPPVDKSVRQPAVDGNGAVRRLSALMLARARAKLLPLVAAPAVQEIWHQIIWAIEEGSLRRFEPVMALNIALKKVREGLWTRPNRMPPRWARFVAGIESCAAA
jgi:hypothetical protein